MPAGPLIIVEKGSVSLQSLQIVDDQNMDVLLDGSMSNEGSKPGGDASVSEIGCWLTSQSCDAHSCRIRSMQYPAFNNGCFNLYFFIKDDDVGVLALCK
jgi:hypothetical protein